MTQQEMAQNERRHSRYHRSLGGVTGGLILVVLGASFLLANQGIITWGHWWQYFLVGLGGVFIIDWLIRLCTGERPMFSGKLVAGIILIGVGTMFLIGFPAYWPVILIVVGVAVLLAGVFGRRR